MTLALVAGSRVIVRLALLTSAMGRHPRWAQELCVVDGSHVVEEVERFLDRVARRAKEGERIASVVERIGLPK